MPRASFCSYAVSGSYAVFGRVRYPVGTSGATPSCSVTNAPVDAGTPPGSPTRNAPSEHP
ncbi:hypothetical protein [Streptomyces sp. YGL11-2]|uniref:hypothetical protein n=1 Tax=Streptomyces sp. YGL11-2 TaxID=3414028 RepID=UPI003CF3354B